MEQHVKKQNSFFQTRMNQAKLGAYYTDPAHCQWIAGLLDFPENEEVCGLEPAIGDGNAIITVMGRRNNGNIHIFGVELNEATADMAINHPLIDECIYGNFLTDAVITKGAFSFCFANPPYGEEDGERLEWRFFSKIVPCLKEQGIFVFVIPYYVMAEPMFLKAWHTNFITECCYRFHEQEYKKWKQVVLIGRKAEKRPIDGEQLAKVKKDIDSPEKIPLLPKGYDGKKIRVLPSKKKDIAEFKNKEFNAERAKRCLGKSALNDLVKEKITQQKFIADNLSRPPIMPNAGQMYLMAISGAGQGLVGSEASSDLHLQRGMVTNVEESEMRMDENGRMVEAVQRFSKVGFQIIENSGMIRRL